MKYKGEKYIEVIAMTVSERFGMTYDALRFYNYSRKWHYVKIRMMIMFFIDEFVDAKRKDVVSIFDKTGSTLNHLKKTVNDLIDTDNAFKNDVEDLRLVLKWRLDALYEKEKQIDTSGIEKVFDFALTVGQLREQLNTFPDDVSFGFRNQPMQKLHHIKKSDFEAVVFQ